MYKPPSYVNFDNTHYGWKPDIDYRKNPQLYKIGKGEQGVLICQPYKSEICPHWKFKTSEIAEKSSVKIYEMFLDYLERDDFVGADLARKYIQMGWTRSRRYYNYKGGRKYKKATYEPLERGTGDPEKLLSANIFKAKLDLVNQNTKYLKMKKEWKKDLDIH